MNLGSLSKAALLVTAVAVAGLSAAAQQDFNNEFFAVGYSHYNSTAGWTLDTDDGVHALSIGGGTNNRFGTENLPEWVGADFVASTWFSVERVEGSGANAISVALVALSNTSTPNNYYLAYWGVGGGAAGATGDLVILRTGGGNFTQDGGVAGLPEIGKVYELRLTGNYDGGALNLTLALFDEDGQQVGTSTVATDPSPLTGPYFGIRNRTAGSNQFLDVDFYRFSVSGAVLAPPQLPAEVLIEFSNLHPVPGTLSHPASAGLSFTVSTSAGRTIDPSDIALFLNDEAIPHGELVIAGASPSFDVSFGGLEANQFYTARVVARDNLAGSEVTWSFDTLDAGSGVSVLEDVALNLATDDAIQGLLGVSSFIGNLPEPAPLTRLTNATSATGPAATTILSPDDPVTITWDLGGSPAQGAHRALTGVDIWISGADAWRTGYDGELAISHDGVDFTAIPETRFATSLAYTGSPVDGVPGTTDGTGTGNFNLVRYQFDPADFGAGFRYLRFISYGYDNLNEGIARQPRIVEIDAFVVASGPYVTNIIPADGAFLQPAAGGLQVTVSTDEGNVIDPQEIALFLNGAMVPAGALTITGASSPFHVSYDGLLPNVAYTARVVVSDNERETTHVWRFDTREVPAGSYVNDFSEEGLHFHLLANARTGTWDLDTSSGSLRYFQPTGSAASAGIGGVRLSGWNGVDFHLSTRFTVNGVQGSGNTITAGFGAFSTASALDSAVAPYYLADWAVGGGGSLGNLRILRLGGGDLSASSTGHTGGPPAIGETYELRLTGTVNDGALNLRLAVFDASGRQVGTAATATDTAPLTGEYFGLRNRTAGANHSLDYSYDFFRMTPPPPQVVDLFPQPRAAFHSADDGIQFTVTAAEGKSIAQENIRFFLNGDEIPPGQWTVTGVSPSFTVSFDGLEVNRFYTAEVIAVDSEGEEARRVWSFDTLDESTTVVIEATDYNFAAANFDCNSWGEPEGGGDPTIGGMFINNPLPSTFDEGTGQYINREQNGTPVGYIDRVGVPGVDYHSNSSGTAVTGETQYRWCDVARTRISSDEPLRPKFVEAGIAAGVPVPDYHLHRVQTGEWWNYTRNLPEGIYAVYLRAAATGNPVIRLDRVTNDSSVGNQETESLGEFAVNGTTTFGYTPLTDSLGQAQLLFLSGEETLRLTATHASNNIDVNFLVLVPATELPPAVIAVWPPHRAGNVSRGSLIEAEISAGTYDLDLGSVRLFVNDVEVAANVTAGTEGATVSATPGNLPVYENVARVEFNDIGGSGPHAVEWRFSVRPQVFAYHALQFDGVSDFVDITGVGGTFGDFTVSGWFKISQQPAEQVIYRITNQEGNTRTIDLRENNGVITASLRAVVAGPLYAVASGAFEYDTWVHIAFVRAGDQLRLYFNGTQVDSTTAVNTPVLVDRKSYLGANPWPWAQQGQDFFRGSIDEFQVWSIARTTEEIAGSMFEALETLILPEAGLHARFGFNEGSGDQAFDYSSGSGGVAAVNARWVPSEIFESTVPPELPVLTIAREGGQVVLTWEGEAAGLEEAGELAGPWTLIEGATSPHVVNISESQRRFFRLRLE